jgi:hypothetical protein
MSVISKFSRKPMISGMMTVMSIKSVMSMITVTLLDVPGTTLDSLCRAFVNLAHSKKLLFLPRKEFTDVHFQ